jgi:hypothetical protein
VSRVMDFSGNIILMRMPEIPRFGRRTYRLHKEQSLDICKYCIYSLC